MAMGREHVRSFLARFVSPLVAGGELHVGAPVAMSDLARWESELDDATAEHVAVDAARSDALASLVVRTPALVLEGDELALAAGLYNALFLVHPRADVWSVGERQRRRIIDTALTMVSRPLTRERTRVLARHALLHNLFRLSRRDTLVSWWTGRARYFGQRPPSRLTAWKGLRHVQEEVIEVGFDELLATPDTAPILATLLRRSPLTQLLDTHSGAPPLHWEDAVFVLRDRILAGAVSHSLVADSRAHEIVKGPARLAAAFEQMLERAPEEEDVRAVAAFLVYLCGQFCVLEADIREPLAKSPLISTVLATEGAAQRPRGLATLLALPGALAMLEPRLAVPPGVIFAPNPHGDVAHSPRSAARVERLAGRWAVHRAQTAELLSPSVIEALAQRLRRHLRSDTPIQAVGVRIREPM